MTVLVTVKWQKVSHLGSEMNKNDAQTCMCLLNLTQRVCRQNFSLQPKLTFMHQAPYKNAICVSSFVVSTVPVTTEWEETLW